MKKEHFRIKAVHASEPHFLHITFGDDALMTIDLSRIIDRTPLLAPLKDFALFSRAGVGEWGLSVVWVPDELELAGDNLRAEGVEQSGGVSHERIWEWMHRNRLNLDTAAKALGISRRMLAYYRSGQRAIPRHIWLACLGWEVEERKAA